MRFDRLFFPLPFKKNKTISNSNLSIIFFIIISMLTIILDSKNIINSSIVRPKIINTILIFKDFIANATPDILSFKNYLNSKEELITENNSLKEESEKNSLWELKARRLEIENNLLKRELSLAPPASDNYITAKITIDTKSLYSQSIIINVGLTSNIQEGQAAITAKGLVGSVVEVYDNYSRVLLITDINSKIPVRIGEKNIKGIVSGSNKEELQLSYLKDNYTINDQDLVYTSGDGGYFNPGIPLGFIKEDNNKFYVIPTNDLQKLQYVQVFLNNFRNF